MGPPRLPSTPVIRGQPRLKTEPNRLFPAYSQTLRQARFARMRTNPMLSHLCSYVLPATLALASVSSLAQALEYKAGSLTITDPWVRAPQGSAQAGGGLAITNTGSAPDHLLGGTASGASRVEVHVTSHEGGTTQMRPV